MKAKLVVSVLIIITPMFSCKSKKEETIEPAAAFVNKAIDDTIFIDKESTNLNVLSNDIHDIQTRIEYNQSSQSEGVYLQGNNLMYDYDIDYPPYGNDTIEYSIYQQPNSNSGKGQSSKANVFLTIGNDAQIRTGNIARYLGNTYNTLLSIDGDTTYRKDNRTMDMGSRGYIGRIMLPDFNNLDKKYSYFLENGKILPNGLVEYESAFDHSTKFNVNFEGIYKVKAKNANNIEVDIFVLRIEWLGYILDYSLGSYKTYWYNE